MGLLDHGPIRSAVLEVSMQARHNYTTEKASLLDSCGKYLDVIQVKIIFRSRPFRICTIHGDIPKGCRHIAQSKYGCFAKDWSKLCDF